MKKKVKKKKGFTLIELLAVIIILGILMIIAVPAVTKYINDSKKSSYINTAKSLTNGVRNIANSEALNMTDINTTYYIPAEYIKTENGQKTPYGEFTEAYVGVICDDSGYKYYWTSSDDSGIGVKNIVPIDKLDIDNIESDIENNTITNQIRTIGIGNREYIKVLNPANETWEDYTVEDTLNNVLEDGGEKATVTYPTGKTKSTVVVGDLVSIGNEDFYVVKHDGNKLLLLAKYNLKVGYIFTNNKKSGEYTKEDSGYGMQSSEATGQISNGRNFKGTMNFARTAYWNENNDNYPADVYSEKSYLKKHVDNYANNLGIVVRDARLLTYDEIIELGCTRGQNYCNRAPSFIYTTSFWLGTAGGEYDIYGANAGENNTFSIVSHLYYLSGVFGIRPLIIV